MFQRLRKKVNAVLPDIESIYISSAASLDRLSTVSSPLKTINPLSSFSTAAATKSTTTDPTITPAAAMQWPNSKAINFNAGCTLLKRNEELWKDIHAMNELNTNKAAESDRMISAIKDSITKHAIDLSDINAALEQIPNIIRTVEKCSATINEIHQKCVDVEEQLIDLEDLMEILELQERQLDKQFEMTMFKERKLGEPIASLSWHEFSKRRNTLRHLVGRSHTRKSMDSSKANSNFCLFNLLQAI